MSIARFFVAPRFEQEEKSRRAWLISLLVNLHIVIAIFTGVAMLISSPDEIYYAAAFLSILPALGMRAFIRKGLINLASVLFVGMIAVLMPLIAWISGSSVATVTVSVFQAVTIVMAGLLLGGRGAFGFWFYTVAIDGLLIYLEIHGIYTTEFSRNVNECYFAQVITFGAIAALLWITNRLIRESFERAHLENQERVIAENGLRLALEAAKMGTWRLDIPSGAYHFSERFLELSGGIENGSGYKIAHPDDAAYVTEVLKKTMAGERERYAIQHRIIALDGSIRWVESWGMLERDSQGQPAMISGLILDITERKEIEEQNARAHIELEQRVAERTAQLEAANKELETYSYTVSHDLRAPLRAISGYTHILMEEHAQIMDEEGQTVLDRILQSSQHMEQLIQDILALASITHVDIHKKRIPMSELACQICDHLREQEPHRQVETQIQPQLTAEGDPHLIKIVLENILSNAWKFTRQQSTAKIEFGSLQQGEDSPLFYVKDNGVGFNQNFAGRLFTAFQRLHSREEFEGTGIGLATVQRILQRHGGRIWAESAGENQGAIFYFSL